MRAKRVVREGKLGSPETLLYPNISIEKLLIVNIRETKSGVMWSTQTGATYNENT